MSKLGDQLASLTKEQAEELRRYIIEEYKICPGLVEGLVGEKSRDKEDPHDYSCFYNSKEFSYWFRGPSGATNG